ncbi:hypothetical protein BP5796_11994 [Coleophoma crateriformis]|uniref:BTB domain-containing protein n=1 Tax=Coleophoma crateriformis TaxID=565419 RepID=A0A3D8QBP4_9HELO|nr:hypothetical protein BP5796_11994 [Coleophoma crateriformis]
MKEALEGKAVFDDVEGDTFERVCQFAYTGDYIAPAYTIDNYFIPSTSASKPNALFSLVRHGNKIPETDDTYGPLSKRIRTSKHPLERSPRQLLQDGEHKTTASGAASETQCIVRKNCRPSENYTSVFLGHAKVYVFAETWGAEALKALALKKLRTTLETFTLYEARRPDIIELLRYAYSDEHLPDRDDLRNLVLLYAVDKIKSLIHTSEWLSLIKEGGTFAAELAVALTSRIK